MQVTYNLNDTKQLKNYFDEHGYIIIDNAFSLTDLNVFKNTLKTAINLVLAKAATTYPDLNLKRSVQCVDEGIKLLRKVDPILVTYVQMTVSRTPEFFRISSNKRISRLSRILLNLPKDGLIYQISNGIIFTTPNDVENIHDSNVNLKWHKDTFYTIPRSRFIQMWAPLIHDADAEIGALQVCPGSQKEHIGQQQYNPDANYNHRYTMKPDTVSQFKPISVNLKLGQLMLFDGNLIHQSGKNTSDKVRTTLLGLIHDCHQEPFKPLAIEYKYLEQTPEEYFFEVFKDEKVKSILKEQSAAVNHFD